MIDGNEFADIKKDALIQIERNDIDVEYLEHRENETLELANGQLNNSSLFIAYTVGNIRLIDNIQI